MATLEEQRKLLVVVHGAIHINARRIRVIAVKPKPPVIPVFRVAASKDGSEIRIINETLKESALFLVETGAGRFFHLASRVSGSSCQPEQDSINEAGIRCNCNSCGRYRTVGKTYQLTFMLRDQTPC